MNQKIVVPMERLISKLILIAFVCNSNLFAVIASGDSIHISGIKETYRSNVKRFFLDCYKGGCSSKTHH